MSRIAPVRAPLEYQLKLPGYEPSPLVDAGDLASSLGLTSVYVKDESKRLGPSSF